MPTIESTLIDLAIHGFTIHLRNSGHAWHVQLQSPSSPSELIIISGTSPSDAIAKARDAMSDPETHFAQIRADRKARDHAIARANNAAFNAVLEKFIKPKPVLDPIIRRI